MSNNQIPILSMLDEHVNRKPLSFHVPGHKGSNDFYEHLQFPLHSILPYDITELRHTDDLHEPSLAILQAMEELKRLYKSDNSYFLVNGSTVGNLAAIHTVIKRGDRVAVQRNSHKSIFNALELIGARPIILPNEYDTKLEVMLGPKMKETMRIINDTDNLKGVILTYPNYFGQCYEIEEIIKASHSKEIPVIVDEAHGAHFIIEEATFPTSALQYGADIVIQSAHKSLPALTMGAFLHVQGAIVNKERLHKWLSTFQSSSPSYLILASLDYARSYLESYINKGDEIVKGIEKIKTVLNECPLIEVVELNIKHDPLKIIIRPVSPKMTGYALQACLDDVAIFTELADLRQVLLMVGIMSENEYEKLASQLEERLKKLTIQSGQEELQIFNLPISEYTSFPYSYEKLDDFVVKEVELEQSIHYICAHSVIPYPPGIPYPLKGERITCEHISYLKKCLEAGGKIQGLNKKILVYEEE